MSVLAFAVVRDLLNEHIRLADEARQGDIPSDDSDEYRDGYLNALCHLRKALEYAASRSAT